MRRSKTVDREGFSKKLTATKQKNFCKRPTKNQTNCLQSILPAQHMQSENFSCEFWYPVFNVDQCGQNRDFFGTAVNIATDSTRKFRANFEFICEGSLGNIIEKRRFGVRQY